MKVMMQDKDGVIQRRYTNSKNYDPKRMKITKGSICDCASIQRCFEDLLFSRDTALRDNMEV